MLTASFRLRSPIAQPPIASASLPSNSQRSVAGALLDRALPTSKGMPRLGNA
ncbi:MAG: hypothetical protein HC781_09315 [Leptolyngbyaceae cyanobacterium CSU_1_4]|nr:hypothetical protein [Leptolyngbyaceae cyanobacterium CSU_1_4]